MAPNMTFWTAIFTLFLVLDPLGNLPVVVSALSAVERRRWAWIVLRESLFALATLILFFFAGPLLFALMGVHANDVRIAGGVVLFIIALRMIFPKKNEPLMDNEVDGEPFLVPLAIPLMAGPSAIATVLLLRGDGSLTSHGTLLGLLAVVLAWSGSTVVLVIGSFVSRKIGPRIMRAVERLAGMLLIVISVHLSMSGIVSYLNGHAL